MNFDRAIFIINEDVRAIKVEYDPETVKNGGKPNTSLFKTLDPDIFVDDFVVVPTGSRAGMTVAQVIEADVDIEIKSGGPVPWLISVVRDADMEEHEKLKSMEADAIKSLMKVEKQNERKQLRESLESYQKDAIQSLAIAHVGRSDDTPPAPPVTTTQDDPDEPGF